MSSKSHDIGEMPEEPRSMRLGEMIAVLWERKWLVIILATAGVALGIVYGLVATRMYRATVTMIPANNQTGTGLSELLGKFGGLASIAGIEAPNAVSKDEALAVLRSKEFVRRFIRDKDLLPQLYPAQWDAQNRKWLDPVKQPSLEDGVIRFSNSYLSISEDRRSGLVTLSVSSRDRLAVAPWANELAERINEELRVRALTQANVNLKYLNEQLGQTDVLEIRQALYQLIKSQSNAAMLATVQREYAFRVIDPGITPEAKRYVSPNKVLACALGLILGFAIAALIALNRGRLSPPRG